MSRNRIRTKTINAGGERCSEIPGSDPYDCNTECCGDDLGENYKEMDCGAVLHYDGSATVGNACVSDNTDACCNAENDCVYNDNCYTDDNDENTVEANIDGKDVTCSLGHWCPEFFEFDTFLEKCIYRPAPCYDLFDDTMCPYDSRTELDLLLKEPLCLLKEDGTHGDGWEPPYSECCCIINDIGETLFSKWCDIETLGLGGEPGGEAQK